VSHPKIVRSKEPIRLFKSDVLEFFTHIHPAVVLAVWAPAIGVLVYASTAGPGAGLRVPVGMLIGLFSWTWVEYVMHRFVFHFRARTPWQERLLFLFHGVHHAQPMSKTRLVMPPALSIPLAGLWYGIVYLIAGVILRAGLWVYPVFAGLLLGYLLYDMLHYATHHFRVRTAAFRYVRRYHLHHHTQTPDMRFGVTSPLWDIVFGTKPAEGG
jgi:sterol desaturase/sphingolipid hydroxylase (fatty acid hydroxylase superfamily)